MKKTYFIPSTTVTPMGTCTFICGSIVMSVNANDGGGFVSAEEGM